MVTASALVDLLTAPELDRLVSTVTALACPALVTLSVVGRVRLRPHDPLDPVVAEAFDLHQRRTVGGRTLLGPDAVGHLATAFARAGARVLSRPSPWRLEATDADAGCRVVLRLGRGSLRAAPRARRGGGALP